MENVIKQEARRLFGEGKQSSAFVQGAFFSLREKPRLGQLARQAYRDAIRRGKTSSDCPHLDVFWSIFEELMEFRLASERNSSAHLPAYTEAAEELADVLICCLTALHSRGVDVEKIITDKINFNKTR